MQSNPCTHNAVHAHAGSEASGVAASVFTQDGASTFAPSHGTGEDDSSDWDRFSDDGNETTSSTALSDGSGPASQVQTLHTTCHGLAMQAFTTPQLHCCRWWYRLKCPEFLRSKRRHNKSSDHFQTYLRMFSLKVASVGRCRQARTMPSRGHGSTLCLAWPRSEPPHRSGEALAVLRPCALCCMHSFCSQREPPVPDQGELLYCVLLFTRQCNSQGAHKQGHHEKHCARQCNANVPGTPWGLPSRWLHPYLGGEHSPGLCAGRRQA